MAKQLIGVLVCSHEAKRGEKWGKMTVSPKVPNQPVPQRQVGFDFEAGKRQSTLKIYSPHNGVPWLFFQHGGAWTLKICKKKIKNKKLKYKAATSRRCPLVALNNKTWELGIEVEGARFL